MVAKLCSRSQGQPRSGSRSRAMMARRRCMVSASGMAGEAIAGDAARKERSGLVADVAQADEAVGVGNEALELRREAVEPFEVPEIDDRLLVDEELRQLGVDRLAPVLVGG